LVFYSKVIEALWYGDTMIPIVIFVLAVTYCISVIMAFVECQPTSLYWTVLPNPGSSSPLSRLISSTADLDLLGNTDKCVRALKYIFISGKRAMTRHCIIQSAERLIRQAP
jgi:hypothetical protein